MYSKPYIIAEAAQGYAPINRSIPSLDIAILLVRAAASSGANAVKFQIIYVDELAEPGYVHYELFKNLEMSQNDWSVIRDEATRLSIDFHADVFGSRSLRLANKINADALKIHSTSFFDRSLLRNAIKLNKPIYLSIGGITYKEILDLISDIRPEESKSNLILMHGFQSEPTPISDNNLLRIPKLAKETGLEIGFMDHSDGGEDDFINLSIMSLAYGVVHFEKHITLDRALMLEDYISAIPPKEFSDYVETLNRIYPALGTEDLKLTKKERNYRDGAVKKIIAKKDIKKGHQIKYSDLTSIRRPKQTGIFDFSQVINKKAKRDIKKGTAINKGLIG